ncbi:MAG: c-type cytochrome [Rhodospirillaceae bacterium]|nr:c-type cytochrome [Rhodospirillaceae bacterium]
MTTGKFLAFGLAMAVALSSFSAQADDDKEKVFKKCASCHSTEKGKHKIGPSLFGVIGRKAGSTDFKKYKAMKDADFTWTEQLIAEWITDQKAFLKAQGIDSKTSMSVKIKKEEDREHIIEFLKKHM